MFLSEKVVTSDFSVSGEFCNEISPSELSGHPVAILSCKESWHSWAKSNVKNNKYDGGAEKENGQVLGRIKSYKWAKIDSQKQKELTQHEGKDKDNPPFWEKETKQFCK